MQSNLSVGKVYLLLSIWYLDLAKNVLHLRVAAHHCLVQGLSMWPFDAFLLKVF